MCIIYVLQILFTKSGNCRHCRPIYNNIARKDMKIFNKIIGQASKITERFSPKLEITQICERVYHCPYPTDTNTLQSILKGLNPQNIQIWNLSEYAYSKDIREKLEKMGFELNQITFQFYSSMPLTISITEINKMNAFLKSSDRNYALVHCQENKSRSILFLAAFLHLSGRVSDIATALALVNQKLGMHSNKTVYSSQHAILRNIANYYKDTSFINKQQLKLLKVIINWVPKIPEVTLIEDQPLLILVQIRRNGAVIYKKVTKQFGQGEIAQFNLKEQNIVLSDDCLFSFKYVFKEKIYPVMRIQLNTNFVFNSFLRVPMHQIDFCKNTITKGQTFADFLFLPEKGKYSELSKLQGHKGVSVQVKPLKKQPLAQPDLNPVNKIVQKQQSQAEDQKNIFHINDDMIQKDELDQKQTEQKLNKLLASMAMKKVQVQQDIKEADNEEDQEQNFEQILTQIKSEQKQQEKTKQANQIVKVSQTEGQRDTKETISSKKAEKQVQEEDQVDIDDYLNKLEEQADQC